MADAGPSLRDYLAVVWRPKWYIWLVTAVVLTVAVFYTSRQTPLYKASTDVSCCRQLLADRACRPGGITAALNEVQMRRLWPGAVGGPVSRRQPSMARYPSASSVVGSSSSKRVSGCGGGAATADAFPRHLVFDGTRS